MYWRRILKTIDRFVNNPPAKALLVAAIVVYLIAQAYLTFPSFGKGYPLRDDDAYGNLVKVAQIKEGCFFQDCPALNDLREQVTEPAEDAEIAGYRNRIYHRFFVVYHPLHSFVLAGLDRLGIDLETGYDILYALGKILLPLAVAYWLISVWGAGPAITALLLLTPMILGGPGLHIIKMHTFVLAFALILWAEIYKRSTRAGVLTILFIVLMSLQHPLGKLLSVASLVFYAAFTEWPLSKRNLVVIGASLLVIVVVFIAPTFIDRPEFQFDPVAFYPGEWDYVGALGASIPQSLGAVSDWMNLFGSALLFAPIALIGFLSRPDQERRKLLVVAGMLAAIFVSGLFYVVPWYGGIAFGRMSPLFAIFLIGAFAAGVNFATASIYQRLRTGAKIKSQKLVSKDQGLTQRGWVLFSTVLAGLAILFSLISYFSTNIINYASFVQSSSNSGNYINRQQLEIVEAETDEKSETTILYMDEYAIHYYLTYGGLQYGALFYTPLRFTPDLDPWLEERQDQIAFAVNRNPLFRLPHTPEGHVLLEDDTSLRIEKQTAFAAQDLALFIGDREQEVVLKIIYGASGEDSVTLRVAAGIAAWVPLPEEAGTNTAVTIHLPDGGQPISIGGMRFAESETLWPWDQGFALVYEAGEESIVVELNSAVIVTPLVFDLTVLDDGGFLILAKVND